jgi:hypothetical protein
MPPTASVSSGDASAAPYAFPTTQALPKGRGRYKTDAFLPAMPTSAPPPSSSSSPSYLSSLATSARSLIKPGQKGPPAPEETFDVPSDTDLIQARLARLRKLPPPAVARIFESALAELRECVDADDPVRARWEGLAANAPAPDASGKAAKKALARHDALVRKNLAAGDVHQRVAYAVDSIITMSLPEPKKSLGGLLSKKKKKRNGGSGGAAR